MAFGRIPEKISEGISKEISVPNKKKLGKTPGGIIKENSRRNLIRNFWSRFLTATLEHFLQESLVKFLK